MHAIDTSNQRANIVYVGATPWHKLGTKFTGDENLEEWRTAAGMQWQAEAEPLYYRARGATGNRVLVEAKSHKALIRSDTQNVLGIVGRDYKVVQPEKVLEFFRDIAFASDRRFAMETAGCLFDGRRVWALARSLGEIRIKGQDVLLPYLLFGTSYDGSTSTFATYITVRVVCHNTLSASVGMGGERAMVRITHAQQYDEHAVKTSLASVLAGEAAAFRAFEKTADQLADTRVTEKQAFEYFARLYGPKPEEGKDWDSITLGDFTKQQKATVAELLDLWRNGPGAQMRSAKDTAWGLVNAVTHLEDHGRTGQRVGPTTANRRLASAQFGAGARRKRDAVDAALAIAA